MVSKKKKKAILWKNKSGGQFREKGDRKLEINETKIVVALEVLSRSVEPFNQRHTNTKSRKKRNLRKQFPMKMGLKILLQIN